MKLEGSGDGRHGGGGRGGRVGALLVLARREHEEEVG